MDYLRTLLLLMGGAAEAYLAYDSFMRGDGDTLGDTESRGPLGKAREVLTWQSIGGDFDIASNKVTGGDAQSELLSNPGFETFTGTEDDGTSDDFASWDEIDTDDPSGDIVEAVTTVHGGSYAVKITRTAGTPYVRQRNITVAPQKLYRFTAWTRGDGSNDGHFIIRDATNAVNTVTDSFGNTNTSYAFFSLVMAAPATCEELWLYLQVASSSTVHYDDASIVECHAEYIDVGVADVLFKAELTTPAAGTDPAGLIVRRSGATQWLVQVTPGTAGTDLELIELDNGAPTTRATADIDWTVDTAYTITVACTAQSIKVYVDGTEKLSYASASVGETNTQFGIWDAAEANFQFDDVELWRYADYDHDGGYA